MSAVLNKYRIKIITLFCGENEFDKCVEMVGRQVCNFYFEQVFIKNKGNLEAHTELYQMIMDEADSFDFFVKLDADMIFKSESSLESLIQIAISSKADIFSIPVHDYMTNSMIWGLNVYRAGVRWHLGTDNLFTDQQLLAGEFVISKRNLSLDESLVSHAEDPSDFQAFVFGIHRATKVTQSGGSKYLIGHAWGQISTIFKVLRAFNLFGDNKRAFAVIGSYYALHKINNVVVVRKDDFFNYFNCVDFNRDIEDSVNYFNLPRVLLLIKVIGCFKLFGGVVLYLKRYLS